MARRKGLRSLNDGKAWRCPSCRTINPPTKHQFFKLPAFQCSGCEKKFKGNFKICLGEVKATGKSLIGEVFDQGQTRFCVPFAYAKLVEITERVSCIVNGDDPDLVEPINPLHLQHKFEKKFPMAVLTPKCLSKDFGLHRVLHMGLILRSEGVQRVDSGDLYKAVGVSTIARDSFEEICQNLAEGIPMVTTYIPGKRRGALRYCQIYKSPQCKSAQIGHAVVIIGAGMKRGKRFFYFLNSWGENFCPRRNIQGHIISGGIGKIKESDLTKNLVKLTHQAGDKRRLDDQCELDISRCNHLLLTLVKKDYNEERVNNLRVEKDASDDGIFRDDEDCMSSQSVSDMQGLVKCMDLYFQRHDGQAVTCEDFYAATCNANNAQLPNFLLCQEVPSTLYQPVKETMFMPVTIGLADSSGKDMSLNTIDSDGMVKTLSSDGQPVFTADLQFNKEQEFTFNNIPARLVSSLLKGYSAPVHLDSDLTESDLIFLHGNDSDKFDRWEVGQVLGHKLMLSLVIVFHQQKALALNPNSVDRLGAILCSTRLDKEFIAQAVTLPCQSEIMDMTPVANYNAAHAVCTFLKKELVFLLKDDLAAVTSTKNSEDDQFNHDSMAHRALKNTCLALSQGQVHAVALLDFYNKWQHGHMAYLLIGGFCGSPVNFHMKDGVGYKFLGEVVLQLDGINP